MDAFYEEGHDLLNYEPRMDKYGRSGLGKTGGEEGPKFATLRKADDTVGWTGARTPLDRAGGDRRTEFEPSDSSEIESGCRTLGASIGKVPVALFCGQIARWGARRCVQCSRRAGGVETRGLRER